MKNKQEVTLDTAMKVIEAAKRAVERGTRKHGDTFNSFQMIGQLWGIYLAHTQSTRESNEILPHDVAEMMSLVKMARMVYGETADNYVDKIGYSALAAKLNPGTEYGDIEE